MNEQFAYICIILIPETAQTIFMKVSMPLQGVSRMTYRLRLDSFLEN